MDSIQVREEHWVIADLKGKAGHVRTVPVPQWVKAAVDVWSTAAGIAKGTVFRSINKSGSVWGDGMTPKVLWEVVKEAASRAGIEKLAPHDLRRTCARLCHLASGELDQIQFLLGHVSIQTTEKYLGCPRGSPIWTSFASLEAHGWPPRCEPPGIPKSASYRVRRKRRNSSRLLYRSAEGDLALNLDLLRTL
jgi:integrase